MCTAVSIGRDPNPPPPAFGLIYEGAIGQPAKIDDISLRPTGERESKGSESKVLKKYT